MAKTLKVVKSELETSTAPITEAPPDALDISSLWTDTGLSDALATTALHVIPVDKPKNYFRVHTNPAYRRRTEILIRKIEGQIETEYYIVAPAMHGRVPGARPCILVTCIYRDGTLRLWPVPLPRDGERDNRVWVSQRSIARVAIDRWVMLVWSGGVFTSRDAQPGYAPDPDWSKVPAYDDLTRAGFGPHGVIQNDNHAVYRDVIGAAPLANDI